MTFANSSASSTFSLVLRDSATMFRRDLRHSALA